MLNLKDYFKNRGYSLNEYENNIFYGKGKYFYIRHFKNELQFGVKKSFDKWANSVDFIIKPPPNNKKEMDKVYKKILNAVRNQEYNKNWGDRINIF